jgi:hypothetical protein
MENTMEKLFKRLPKKYHERVDILEAEDGLIDNCKYMLYFKDGWKFHGEYKSVPVFSITEAIRFIKESCQ